MISIRGNTKRFVDDCPENSKCDRISSSLEAKHIYSGHNDRIGRRQIIAIHMYSNCTSLSESSISRVIYPADPLN